MSVYSSALLDLKSEDVRNSILEFFRLREAHNIYAISYLEKLPIQSNMLCAVGVFQGDRLKAVGLRFLYRIMADAETKDALDELLRQWSTLDADWPSKATLAFEPVLLGQVNPAGAYPGWQSFSDPAYEYLLLEPNDYTRPKIEFPDPAVLCEATPDHVARLSNLLKGSHLFNPGEQNIKLQILLGDIWVAVHPDGGITSAVGASVVSSQAAMIDLTYSAPQYRGKREFEALGVALVDALVSEGLRVYCYTVHPAVKKLTSQMGFKNIGQFVTRFIQRQT